MCVPKPSWVALAGDGKSRDGQERPAAAIRIAQSSWLQSKVALIFVILRGKRRLSSAGTQITIPRLLFLPPEPNVVQRCAAPPNPRAAKGPHCKTHSNATFIAALRCHAWGKRFAERTTDGGSSCRGWTIKFPNSRAEPQHTAAPHRRP